MKKILSLALASAMVVAALPVAYAAENEANYDAGTQITYIGSQEKAAGGAGDVWTVTVPAKMVPGDTGTVKAEGMWNSDKFLEVKAPTSVALTYGAQTMDVSITFTPIYKIGSSTDEVAASQDITVADASRLFGTWTGTLTYEVNLINKGDINNDGVIDAADYELVHAVYGENKTLEDDEISVYDINGDGKWSAKDYNMMLNLARQNGFEVASE